LWCATTVHGPFDNGKLLEESMTRIIRKYATDRQGVTLIEYGLIAALIAVALATILGTVGTNLSTLFNTISTAV
jgi:pilus assembly protein Flp/PilA